MVKKTIYQAILYYTSEIKYEKPIVFVSTVASPAHPLRAAAHLNTPIIHNIGDID